MPPAKPAVIKLSDLASGQTGDCFAQLVERVRTTTQSGKPFFSCRFRDSRRTLNAVIWGDSPLFVKCEKDWQPGQFFKLRARCIETEKYGTQLEIKEIRQAKPTDEADGFDPLDLVDRTRFDPKVMFADLRTLVETEIRDEPLRLMVTQLLDRYAEVLQTLPGSSKHYYPFAGGWIEHTLSVTKSCIYLSHKYSELYPELQPPLNSDLVVAAAVLHDIGRVAELTPPFGLEPTVPGRLMGHLFLGRDMVREVAQEIKGLDPELLMALEHIVISHLSLPEWGSPRLPAIPECLILHHADDLDAKMEMYMRCLARDQSAGPFTDRDPVLGKPLWKGRKL